MNSFVLHKLLKADFPMNRNGSSRSFQTKPMESSMFRRSSLIVSSFLRCVLTQIPSCLIRFVVAWYIAISVNSFVLHKLLKADFPFLLPLFFLMVSQEDRVFLKKGIFKNSCISPPSSTRMRVAAKNASNKKNKPGAVGIESFHD